jgi:phosphatidylserine/phosphatidylglycerophosphate/cardiolipin synthase-like enzyme
MRTLRLAVVALFCSGPVLGAVIVGPAEIPALPPSASVAASLGATLGGQVLQTAGAISLRSPALTLSGLLQLRQSVPTLSDPQQKAAAVAVLGAIAQPEVLEQRLKDSDLPPAAVTRILAISEKLSAAADASPQLAQKVVAERSADAALSAQIAVDAEALPADLIPTLQAFLQWGHVSASASSVIEAPAPAAVSPRGRPVAPQGQDWSKVGPKTLLDPSQRPTLSFGAAKLPVIAQPTLGDDISALWNSAHDQSRSALIAMYNFDDMDMAKAIVAASKKGQKQVIVGDYSNWFPERMPEAVERAKKEGKPLPQPTAAMQYITANLNANIQLYILKGLGSIGINHNKFTLFTAAGGQQLLQSGSFNYTQTSQNNHWENVVFTDDADRIAFFKNYHAWLVRRARKYAANLQPADAVMDLRDPIPQDPSRSVVFHGVPFPKVSGSPGGTTEDWLAKAEGLVSQTLDILMFSPFPTPKLSAAIQTLLAKGIPVRLIADRGEVSQAGFALTPLLDKGMKLKTIEGPDVVLKHQPYSQRSKQHEKVMIFDGAAAGALAKLGDSLNISQNALNDNFENTQFWQGFHAAYMQAHFNYLWNLASAPTQELLAKLRDEYNRHVASAGGQSSPQEKHKAPHVARGPQPGKLPSRAS